MSGIPRQASLLRHVAIITDGNNRWARQRGLPGPAGHKAGVERLRDVMETCRAAGVEALTVFAFSSENWQRPPAEVTALMNLFSVYLSREKQELREKGISVRVIGSRERFSPKLLQLIDEAEEFTRGGSMLLNIAADYGGRWDIVQATRKLASDVLAGSITLDQITEDALAQYISLADLPPPDLCVRTGGEQRISNFLLWQFAYTEFYFTDVFWPDFGKEHMQAAIDAFFHRERRFGLSGEQLSKDGNNA